jgi:hypothetical protein
VRRKKQDKAKKEREERRVSSHDGKEKKYRKAQPERIQMRNVIMTA